ncbi:uncharacterized protein LOC110875656 [Helianthus annuus]|uniref:uncharacterized protein LOC110875656 n=1 Tax=Helianthus annuus TaxID=4232 RepID=UPI000B904FC9|nr:uncharacterized protein LOC110875656 [Helianthus annuus]
MSYIASSYVIEQIVLQQPDATPVFNSVPPPIWNYYTQKYPDGVEAALNLKQNLKLRTIENELPESIDVTFSPSDTDNESQVIKTVVDQVLDEESDNSEPEIVKTQSENSMSDSEEDGNFLDRFIPKSDKVANDDSIIVVYTMVGIDKLYSDFEYLLQNARIESVEKVFKLVEIDISEVNNNTFFSKPKKSFVTQQPKKSGKKGSVGNHDQNKRQGNNLKKKGVGFEKKMAKNEGKPKERLGEVFVTGKSTVEEKEYIFSRKAIDDFNAAKKLIDETFKSTFVEYDKRICYRCNEIVHMAKQCMKNLEKPILQNPRPKTPTDNKGKKPMISPVRILKRGEFLKSEEKPKSTFEVGESSKVQKTSKIYPKTKVFENQSWVVKPKSLVEEKKMENVLKTESKVFKDDVYNLSLNLINYLKSFHRLKKKSSNQKSNPWSQMSPLGLPKSFISKWIMDSGASRHMTGMLALLYDVNSLNGGYVGFAGNQGGRIVGQGTLTNRVISFDKVNYIIELENNLLSISQICDKSFTVHFTKNECLVLKPGVKIPDDMVLLRAPRENDLYILDMSVATTTDHQKQCFVTKTKATEKE